MEKKPTVATGLAPSRNSDGFVYFPRNDEHKQPFSLSDPNVMNAMRTAFIEGAKEGFTVAIKITPYLVAMLVAIGLLRTSGTMDIITNGISSLIAAMGFDTSFTGALPVGLMKPFSGSGARGLMVDAMTAYGPDSFVGRLACIINGSTDTTFYILALYFGSVGIRNTRYAAATGLLADLAGLLLSIAVAYLFFA